MGPPVTLRAGARRLAGVGMPRETRRGDGTMPRARQIASGIKDLKEINMEVLDMLDTSRGEAVGIPTVGNGGVGLGSATQDVGGKPASPFMVRRVMDAAAAGRTGLLEWIEAWGTAAIIDGRCRSITVEGAEVVVSPGTRRGTLSRIDLAVPMVEATGRGVVDVAITALVDDEGPVVRVVVTRDRFELDTTIRTIRLAPSIRPEPTSQEAFPDEDALEPRRFARCLRTGLPTLAEVGHPWA